MLSGRSLLVQIELHATLSALALVMHVRISLLLCPISRERCRSSADRTLHSVTDALSQVGQLSLCLLSLALSVLLSPLLLDALIPDEVAQRFFRRADGLVPLALSAVAAVFGRPP